jgi:hypothetical protein
MGFLNIHTYIHAIHIHTCIRTKIGRLIGFPNLHTCVHTYMHAKIGRLIGFPNRDSGYPNPDVTSSRISKPASSRISRPASYRISKPAGSRISKPASSRISKPGCRISDYLMHPCWHSRIDNSWIWKPGCPLSDCVCVCVCVCARAYVYILKPTLYAPDMLWLCVSMHVCMYVYMCIVHLYVFKHALTSHYHA